jgi:DNA helicase-2/ATP-dependent DNA helicase PcrA
MGVDQHPEHEEESKRLQDTQKAIDIFIGGSAKRQNSGADAWAGAALDNRNRELIRLYEDSRAEPYFGRFDFHAVTRAEAEKIYLGYQALNLGEFEVIDWRAPVGSLFASSQAEHQSYKAPEGIIKGRLLLRRRFQIADDTLKKITDEFDRRKRGKPAQEQVKPTSNEDYLIQELYTRGDPKLQDIVKTIQKQQDEIIRAKHDHVVLINGVAGSGKTSIAIHRMAYLLYPANNTNIRAAYSIIFCPNPIFLHYIEDLLPRLGERGVKQTTFAEWALSQMKLEGKYKVVDSSQSVFLSPHVEKDLLKRLWMRARLKGNLKIKQLLEAYVEYLKHAYVIPESGLSYHQIGELNLDFIFSADEIREMILKSLATDSDSLVRIHDSALFDLRKTLQQKYDDDVNAKSEEIKKQADTLEGMAAGIEDLEERNLLLEEVKSKRQEYDDFRAKAFAFSSTKQRTVNLVSVLLQKDYNKIWTSIDLVRDYYSLFQDKTLLSKMAEKIYNSTDIDMLFMADHVVDAIESEDLAALLYFSRLMNGDDQPVKYDHIIVDEVQDFSPLQLELIYSCSTGDSMTLVGDIAQGIHAYRGVSDWKELTAVFPTGKITLQNITQSYRSTQELVHFANDILKQSRTDQPLLAKPLSRHGNPPVIVHVREPDKLKDELFSRIQSFEKQGYKNIAVITKTPEQAFELIGFLDVAGANPKITIKEMETEFKYSGGLVVLPVTLAKGMEFEAVILYNVNETEYNSQQSYDGRLLYVGVTRALHEMQILYTGQISGFLKTAQQKAKLEKV